MKKAEINSNSVFIGGKEYLPKDEINAQKTSTNGLPYVCIRTYSAGVHFGYLKEKESTFAGMEVILLEGQRMRYWEGAMDLNVLSTTGSSKPDKCKPSVIVPEIRLVAIEIIPVSEIAFTNIKSMKIWK